MSTARRDPLAAAARAILTALAILAAAPTAARAEPSDRRLVVTGLALTPPTYLLGVALHEGSHALAAKLLGAEVLDVHLFPPGRDPRANKFRFGWTHVRGLRGRGVRTAFFVAPKLTDAALLGGFAALAFTDAWPDNRYAALALTVVATGLWVDFAKDIPLLSRTTDVTRAEDLWCLRGWRRIAPRVLYAAAAVGLGLVVARGYRRTFGDRENRRETGADPAQIVPLAGLSF